jgi:predicted NACHT family NTPase
VSEPAFEVHRSELIREVNAYCRELIEMVVRLAPHYPAHIHGTRGLLCVRPRVRELRDANRGDPRRAEEEERRSRAGEEPVPRFHSIDWWNDLRRCPRDLSIRLLEWDEPSSAHHRRAVILGVEGSGKTWLLRQEAAVLAERAVDMAASRAEDLKRYRLPLYVSLPLLDCRSLPLVEAMVAQTTPGRSETFRTWLVHSLKSGRGTVLLDGWDKVSAQARDPLRERIWGFAAAAPDTLGIRSTSRFGGYPGVPDPWAEELELLPWETARIQGFVQAWWDEDSSRTRQFAEYVTQLPELRGLVRCQQESALRKT